MNGLVGMNGASRPHLYTAETRMMAALSEAQERAPTNAHRFIAIVRERTGCDDATALTYWRVWARERVMRPFATAETVELWTDGRGNARAAVRG